MNTALYSLALLMLLLAGVLLYLVSPNQRLLRTALPRILMPFAWLLLGLALLVLLSQFGPATAVFILLTVLMLIWSVPPLVFAWFRARREGRK